MPGDVEQARQALGARLREIRIDARLTGRELAGLAGWHFTKVSRLEHGKRPPSLNDIETWCLHCHAQDQVRDLVATAHAVDAMYTEWRRKMRSGLKHFQDSYFPLYEQTTRFRNYQTMFMPDLLATADYTAAVLQHWAELMSLPADIDAAVEARMRRQDLLYKGPRRFEMILEEQALRTNVGGPEVMSGQLDRLMTMAMMPRVNMGIVPARALRTAMMQSSFWIFDTSLAHVETPSALLAVTQPAEIGIYVQTFDLLRGSALYGHRARELIVHAADELAA